MESLPFLYQKREYWEFYCPICKNLRRSFYWPAPRKKHYWRLALLGLLQTLACWPFFQIKGIFLIFPVWAGFEFFYRARARQSLICPHCGFDPYIYKYDVALAREKVAKFFAEKKARQNHAQVQAQQNATTDSEKNNSAQDSKK